MLARADAISACLKTHLTRAALRLESRLQAVCAGNRLKAELQTGFSDGLQNLPAINHTRASLDRGNT